MDENVNKDGSGAEIVVEEKSFERSQSSDSESSEDVYEVEKIISKKIVNGKLLYKVRWKSYSPAWDTFEPPENLETCKDLIEDFMRKEEEKKKNRQKKSQHWTYISSDDDDDNSGAKSLLKDKFWKDLEQGKINVMKDDLYSKIKSGRAAKPKSLVDRPAFESPNCEKKTSTDNEKKEKVEKKGKEKPAKNSRLKLKKGKKGKGDDSVKEAIEGAIKPVVDTSGSGDVGVSGAEKGRNGTENRTDDNTQVGAGDTSEEKCERAMDLDFDIVHESVDADVWVPPESMEMEPVAEHSSVVDDSRPEIKKEEMETEIKLEIMETEVQPKQELMDVKVEVEDIKPVLEELSNVPASKDPTARSAWSVLSQTYLIDDKPARSPTSISPTPANQSIKLTLSSSKIKNISAKFSKLKKTSMKDQSKSADLESLAKTDSTSEVANESNRNSVTSDPVEPSADVGSINQSEASHVVTSSDLNNLASNEPSAETKVQSSDLTENEGADAAALPNVTVKKKKPKSPRKKTRLSPRKRKNVKVRSTKDETIEEPKVIDSSASTKSDSIDPTVSQSDEKAPDVTIPSDDTESTKEKQPQSSVNEDSEAVQSEISDDNSAYKSDKNSEFMIDLTNVVISPVGGTSAPEDSKPKLTIKMKRKNVCSRRTSTKTIGPRMKKLLVPKRLKIPLNYDRKKIPLVYVDKIDSRLAYVKVQNVEDIESNRDSRPNSRNKSAAETMVSNTGESSEWTCSIVKDGITVQSSDLASVPEVTSSKLEVSQSTTENVKVKIEDFTDNDSAKTENTEETVEKNIVKEEVKLEESSEIKQDSSIDLKTEEMSVLSEVKIESKESELECKSSLQSKEIRTEKDKSTKEDSKRDVKKEKSEDVKKDDSKSDMKRKENGKSSERDKKEKDERRDKRDKDRDRKRDDKDKRKEHRHDSKRDRSSHKDDVKAIRVVEGGRKEKSRVDESSRKSKTEGGRRASTDESVTKSSYKSSDKTKIKTDEKSSGGKAPKVRGLEENKTEKAKELKEKSSFKEKERVEEKVKARGVEESKDKAGAIESKKSKTDALVSIIKKPRDPPKPSRVIHLDMLYPKFQRPTSDKPEETKDVTKLSKTADDIKMEESATSAKSMDETNVVKDTVKKIDTVEDMDICDDVDIDEVDDEEFMKIMDKDTEHLTEADLVKMDQEMEEIKNLVLTPVDLKMAVKKGDYQKLNLVMSHDEAGVYNLEICDHTGMTLLMMAASSDHVDVCDLLVRHGAQVNARQKTGATALLHAADRGHYKVVTKLLQLGAHVNVQNSLGESALMRAVKKGHTSVVEALLNYGPNTSQTNNADMTALRFSQLMKNLEIRQKIERFNERLNKVFREEISACTSRLVHVLDPIFPIQCLSLCEGRQFNVHFNHELKPSKDGIGAMLFIAHGLVTPEMIQCRLFGACAVRQVNLNKVAQMPLTQSGMYMMTFSPLHNGKNDLDIRTDDAPRSKAKLIVAAYNVRLIEQ